MNRQARVPVFRIFKACSKISQINFIGSFTTTKLKTVKMTLRKLLIIGAALLSLFLIIALFFSIQYVAVEVYSKSTFAHTRQTADRTSQVLLQIMRRGWSREEMETFTSQITGENAAHEVVSIFRGDRINERYGMIAQPPMSMPVLQAFRKGDKVEVRGDGFLQSSYPIIAASECLGCHKNAKPGEVLGVIDIRKDIQAEISSFRSKMLYTIIPIAIFPFIGSIFLGLLLHRKIGRSLSRFHKDVQELNSFSDLAKVKTNEVPFPLEDFNLIKRETNLLIDKIKQVAIDRETMEFEIKLLEKLLITSEVIRDWREQIKSLLVDMNRIMETAFIFSMFYVEENVYELEVFWLRTPSAEIRKHFEVVIDTCLRREFPYLSGCAVEHHTSVSSVDMADLHEADIDIHTKKIFLDAPRIGGIVGVGLLARNQVDHVKALVVEGILTTLLNVIGSVKAIYKYTQEVEYYATRDPLTGLYNQRFFRDLFEQEVFRAQRTDRPFAIVFLDIDNFKTFNDTYGHSFGDRFLQAVASRLKAAERSGDILARFAGDEFAVFLPDTDADQAYTIACRLLVIMKDTFLEGVGGEKVSTSVSAGVVSCPVHGATATDLILMAGKLLEKAKYSGKDRALLPSEDDIVEIFRAKSEKAHFLKRALDDNLIIPYFQPIYDFNGQEIVGHEVLMRIRGEDGRLIMAQDFIEIAEEMGIINRMDLNLIEKVFEKVHREQYQGMLFLNVSPKDLTHAEFMKSIDRLVVTFGIKCDRIVFELTEREAVRNLGMVEKFVLDLKMKGFRFALDDFGSGYSSYFYIKKFPIDFIKIEGDFVRGMLSSEVDMAVVESICVLARRINVKVIAESVENAALCRAVQKLGADCGQGYFLKIPGPDFSQAIKLCV